MSWLPTVVVAAGSALTYGAAMVGFDAFASTVHAVVIAMALGVTLATWGWRRRWPGLAGFFFAKLVVVALLLPGGDLAAPFLGYEELRFVPGALDYFWAVPALLLAITVVESWSSSLVDSGRALSETWVGRNRSRLVLLASAVLLVAGAWRLWGAEYYLWKLRREGHGPQSSALADMGPRVLPRLYEELDSLGERPAGEVRSTLVAIIRDIRYDQVAARRRARLLTIIETTPVEIDAEMVEQLSDALAREPSDEERHRMTIWLGELDYRMAAATFCSAFPRVPEATWDGMLNIIGASVGHATRDPHPPGDSLHPWRGMSEAEIAARKNDIADTLRACVPDVLVPAFACVECDDGFTRKAARTLAALARLSDAHIQGLRSAIAQMSDAYLVKSVVEHLAPVLSDGDPATIALETLRGEATAEAREGVILWIAYHEDDAAAEELVCSAFPDLSAAER